MNPKDTSRILDHVAADFISDNTNLLPQIITKYKGNAVMRTLKARPVLAILLVLFGLTIITGAAYAIGKISGFIPGFGFVTDASIVHVLDAPVEVSNNDLIVQVVRAVNDDTRFWVMLALTHNPSPETFYNAEIVLPDGKLISSGQAGWHVTDVGEVNILFEFPPLPVETTTLNLQFVYGLSSQDEWETISIPLTLRTIQIDEVIPAQPVTTISSKSETHGGVTMVLQYIAPAADKTFFQVALQSDQPQYWLNSTWSVNLTGKNGEIYPIKDITPEVYDGVTKLYETIQFSGGEEIIFSLATFPIKDTLPMMADFSSNPISFRFNPGADPQAGQHWGLTQMLQVENFKIQLIGATLTAQNFLVFEFESKENVTGVMLKSDQANGATGGMPITNGVFTSELSFEEFPNQPFDVQIASVFYSVTGNWQIHWQAPPAPENPLVDPTQTPRPTPTVLEMPTTTSDDPLLQEVQALVQDYDRHFQTGPGWVHVIRETESTSSIEQTFPPAYMLTEQWLRIDTDGYVVKW